MPTNLQSVLQELSSQARTDNPFLTLYLDWTPDGNGQRPVMQMVAQELERMYTDLGDDHGPARESISADRERITNYLNSDAPKDANGLAIFACNAENVWTTVALQAGFTSEVVQDHYPHLFQLARMIDDYETYAVAIADGQESRIMVVSLTDTELAGTTEASEEIKRFDQGGPAQMLFQRRTQNLVKAHTKDIAAELEKIIKQYDVQHVVISVNDSVKGALMSSLSAPIKEKLLDTISLDKSSANLASIVETVDPMIREAERKQEQDDVTELENQAYSQGLGVVGPSETAMALSKGQVRTLVILESFSGQGSEAPDTGSIFGEPTPESPYTGAQTLEIDLREAFVARAIQQGANVQVVDTSDYLEKNGGVGALLRYRDTAEMTPEGMDQQG